MMTLLSISYVMEKFVMKKLSVMEKLKNDEDVENFCRLYIAASFLEFHCLIFPKNI